MADDSKERKLLLEKELTIADCFALGQTMQTPGFDIIRRLYEAACEEANKDAIRLDPEGTDYDRKLAVRTQRARNFNEIVEMVRTCALIHHNRVSRAREMDEENAKEAVASVFGIHPAKPATKGEEAIKNVFGIHPAKPKKSPVKGKQSESNAAKDNKS